ncbi:uncharacterized protein haspin [Mugil cephalus]|uniref:uncharacterized protein haspin n=1 Tax=Mugil cephalus TaxID=48193 RepID=UPI001FB80D03|nr:uncharacterized protein haspin [Mugil cephalus]
MEPSKPLFLKTYGKQRRKLSAWILPSDRKQVFDSTASPDDNSSLFEQPGPKTTREKKAGVGRHKSVRPAKRRALQDLNAKGYDEGNTSNEENIIMPRGQRTRVNRSKTVRPAKRKATQCLTDTSSDEENIGSRFHPPPQLTHQSKQTRKGRFLSVALTGRKRKQVSDTSQSEDKMCAPKRLKNSYKMKTHSNVHPPSAGRFVTRRRRAAVTKPKLTKAILNSSSDEFASEASHRNLQPYRKRRNVPPAFAVSSAENSVNGISGFATNPTNPFREISLNELADRSPRKPIFCSTPSAGSFSKRDHRVLFPVSDQSSIPPSVSVISLSALSTSPDGLDSIEQLVSPPHLERPPPSRAELQKQPDMHHREEPSVDLYSSCSEEAKSRGGGRTKGGGGLAGVSSDGGSSSHFVSAAGGLEWLVEALKEQCLTHRCTVELKRLDHFFLAQLHSETASSSCLEGSASSQRTNQPHFVDRGQTIDFSQSLKLYLSLTSNKTSDDLQSVNTSEQVASASNCHSTNSSQSIDCDQSAQLSNSSMEPSGSTRDTDGSFEVIVDTRLQSSGAVQTLFTGEEAKYTSLLKKCCVPVKKVDLSDLTEVFTQQQEPALVCSEKSVNRRASKWASDDQTKSHHTSESDCCEDTSSGKAGVKPVGSSSSSDVVSSDREVAKNSSGAALKRKKMSQVPKEKRRRSASKDRTGTTRKVCVSGSSVTRWTNKSSAGTHVFNSRTAQTGGSKAVECSIHELISSHHQQPRDLFGGAMNFSTPLRTNQLSSLLANFTPNTHTWSRLKAALSVHRKVLLTPRSEAGTLGRTALADLSQDLFASSLRTPLSKRSQSQLLRDYSLVVSDDADLSDAEKVYAECGQQQPLPWEECILPQYMKQCVKVGEGTFGEVFSITNASGDAVALKVIPVEGSEKVNGEDQKTFGEILHEIIISKELSSLKEKQHNQTHGFIGLNNLHCVQGCYPPDFMNAWDKFDQRKGSENDRPDFFDKDQLFIILEFEFGGVDLENSNGTLSSLVVAKSILHQVTAALAVAEQELRFEHRDLHWGNLLVKATKHKTGSFLLNGTAHSLETRGVHVRIIDYSLSRLEIDDLTVSCDISNDEELFMGQGDYQFDIYRLMRQENGNNWSEYCPHTNVLWLHYLCSKLLSMKYRGSGGRGAKDVREELTRFYDNVLQYKSATSVLQECPMFQ